MHRALIRNGKLSMSTPAAERYQEWKAANEGAEVFIDLFKVRRTSRQHRYYFAYLAAISTETGDDVPSLHAFFKRKFLPPIVKTVMGEEVQFAPSTTGLDKAQFSEYLDRICALMRRVNAQVAAGNRKRVQTERGELLTYFVERINAERRGTKYEPVGIKYVAFKVTGVQTPDLYALKSKMEDASRRGAAGRRVRRFIMRLSRRTTHEYDDLLLAVGVSVLALHLPPDVIEHQPATDDCETNDQAGLEDGVQDFRHSEISECGRQQWRCHRDTMKAHKSQVERIEGRLIERGFITRNQCLSTFPAITRLGARIKDLEKKGWRFEAKAESGDYVYRVVSAPKAEQLPLG